MMILTYMIVIMIVVVVVVVIIMILIPGGRPGAGLPGQLDEAPEPICI